jgi:hypothetical protein
MTRKDYIELVDIFGKFTAMVGTDNVKINEQSQQAIQTYIRFLMSDIYKLLKRDNSRFGLKTRGARSSNYMTAIKGGNSWKTPTKSAQH